MRVLYWFRAGIRVFVHLGFRFRYLRFCKKGYVLWESFGNVITDHTHPAFGDSGFDFRVLGLEFVV